MCTALSLTTDSHYFGRTLDLEHTLSESVVIAPRRFPLPFRFMPHAGTHLSFIGMASVQDGFPLYYDAVNESGLCAAALNFPGFACYAPTAAEKTRQIRLASFEVIPFVLSRCASVSQARALLERAVVCSEAFSCDMPPTPLHWMFGDGRETLVVEPLEGGLRLHDNPAGVLTNSPPFEEQMRRLGDYAALSPAAPPNTLAPQLRLPPVSRGTGTFILPGGMDSPSRFVRAAYLRAHSVCPGGEEASVSQFFHILDAVSVVRGSVCTEGENEITQYACCMSAQRGVYCFTTYENRRITAIDMRREDLSADAPIIYPLIAGPQILMGNG